MLLRKKNLPETHTRLNLKDQDKFADRNAERAVLCMLLNDAELLIEVAAKLEEKDFLSEHHRVLYSILGQMYANGMKSFDLMAIAAEAEKWGALKLIGEEDYIKDVADSLFDPANLDVYLDKIHKCSTKFKLYKKTEFIRQDLLSADDSKSTNDIIASAEEKILEVSMDAQRVEDAINIADGSQEYIEQLLFDPVEFRGLPTGIELLDKSLNGLAPGSLTIIAGRAKGGKSTFMMNIASYLAYGREEKTPILYIDTEMSTNEVRTRLVSHLSGVPERSIINGSASKNEQTITRINGALDKLYNGCFYHKYYPGYSMEGVKSIVRKYKARENIGVLFFDYIKIPEVSGSSAKEHQLLGNVTTALKDLAGSLNIPIVAGAQLKRSEGSGNKTHYHDNDVADSDKIIRYCSSLLTIARKSKKELEEDGLDCGTHRVQVLAARGGGELFKGIDLECKFPTLTMKQAEHQSNGIPNFGEEQSSGW